MFVWNLFFVFLYQWPPCASFFALTFLSDHPVSLEKLDKTAMCFPLLQSPVLDLPIGSVEWLSCAQRQLEDELNMEQRNQEEREQQLETCGETLQLLVDSIKTILSNHNRHLADVKHLLRAMAKVHLRHTHTADFKIWGVFTTIMCLPFD